MQKLPLWEASAPTMTIVYSGPHGLTAGHVHLQKDLSDLLALCPTWACNTSAPPLTLAPLPTKWNLRWLRANGLRTALPNGFGGGSLRTTRWRNPK